MIKKISEVIEIIKKAGYKAYLVGGSSRDLLLSRSFSDIDITTSCPIDKLSKMFEVINKDGKPFGSVKIKYKNTVMEITRFREEQYDNSTYPSKITFVDDVLIDAKRRDFSINCIYLDITNNTLVDPYDGLKDLMEFKIKFIGDPNTRIHEDPTRIFRAIRFKVKLNFTMDDKTDEAIKNNVSELERLSSTRYEKEINHLIDDIGAIKAQKTLEEYGIMIMKKGD